MNLINLINDIPVIQAIGDFSKVDITNICYDSRKVKKGSLFIAIKGFNLDGHNFIYDAINNGASALVVEDISKAPANIQGAFQIPVILVRNSRRTLALLSHKLYNNPSSLLKVIGVTGTNGKTTSTYIIKAILEEAGFKVGLIGTIKNLIGSEELKTEKTTPESVDLCEIFDKMLSAGCQYCVMEVSSHALELERVTGVNFCAAMFTNLTQDHLDFHGNFDNYFNAKKKLFDNLDVSSVAVTNSDDKYGIAILKDTPASKITYGSKPESDFYFSSPELSFDNIKFKLSCNDNSVEIKSRLSGKFNLYNITGASALTASLGISLKNISAALNKLTTVHGRFMTVSAKSPLKVIVDYSHTPDALENTLKSVKEILLSFNSKGKIITVFGAGGNRDKAKRPLMGKIVESLSDKIIVTTDNPRFEDPADIISDILTGISNKDNVDIIEDREKAIEHAINIADETDVILIAGKGHEDYQDIKGVKKYFDDRIIAEKYLNLRFGL